MHLGHRAHWQLTHLGHKCQSGHETTDFKSCKSNFFCRKSSRRYLSIRTNFSGTLNSIVRCYLYFMIHTIWIISDDAFWVISETWCRLKIRRTCIFLCILVRQLHTPKVDFLIPSNIERTYFIGVSTHVYLSRNSNSPCQNRVKSSSITWPIMGCILVMVLAVQFSFSNQEHIPVFKIFVTLLCYNTFLIFSKLSISLSLDRWPSDSQSPGPELPVRWFRELILKIFLVRIFQAWVFYNFQWCTMLRQGHHWRFLVLPSFYSDTYITHMICLIWLILYE